MTFTVEPFEGKAHEGRQYGYVVTDGEEWAWNASTGGTGACWNVSDRDGSLHICDLDAFIAALTALRNSDAHKKHVERWA